MTSTEARNLYSALNNDGRGFALTDSENALVVVEIAEAGLTVVADHGDGLIECRDAQGRVVLVGGDGRRRGAWAVRVARA
jgi:hypothetical protein